MSKKKKKRQKNVDELNNRKEERKKQEHAKRRKDIINTSVVAVLGLLVVTAALVFIIKRERSAYDTVVFKVGDEAVRKDEINLCMFQNVTDLGINESMLSEKASDGTEAADYYKKEILDVIMDYKVESMIAKKQGISLSENEKQTVRTDAIDYTGKINARILNELGITRDRIIEIYEQRYLAHKLEDTVQYEGTVEDQKFVTIYLMLFPKVVTDDNGDFETEEDGVTPVMLSDEDISRQKDNADAAYKELAEEDADPDAVAEKYGVTMFSGQKSNLADSFDEPFSKYANELSEGEISPVIDIESCYAIVKMIKSNNEEMAAQIMVVYQNDMKSEALEEQKKEWYKEAGISGEPQYVGDAWNKMSLYDFVKYIEE